VDNFTNRDQLVRDALPVLDHKVNKILSRAVETANRESPGYCNHVIVRREILRFVGPDPVSFLELWATSTDDVQHAKPGSYKGIYSGASLAEAPAIWLAGIGRSFKLAGHVVGTDKLGHFFMQGYDYYKREQGGEPLEKIFRKENGEDGIWGLTMTGVKSYADMAANYQGLQFWNHLFGHDHPYLRCQDDRWAQVRQFTWADYVSDAWDEAINCSDMKPSLEAKVERNLARIGMQCPIKPDKCRPLASLKGSKYFLGPKCQAVIHGQVER
jgi:hypothetical protein